MHQRGQRNRSAGRNGEPALVTDTAVLTEADTATSMQQREGDPVFGLRCGLALGASLWLALIILGFLLFG